MLIFLWLARTGTNPEGIGTAPRVTATASRPVVTATAPRPTVRSA